MNGKPRVLVSWSPHDSGLFAVGAENLRLYESYSQDLDLNGAFQGQRPLKRLQHPTTQRKRSFRMVKMNADATQIKCMEWFPGISNPLLIGLGVNSGKILLSDFDSGRNVAELVPKYSRPCNAVAWNYHNQNQIAAGFEKVRSGFCTLVWDVNMQHSATVDNHNINRPSNLPSGLTLSKQRPPANAMSGSGRNLLSEPSLKPIYEFANSEATIALSWVPSQPSCLATGTGFKWLRVYDLRSKATAPMSVVAHTKGVYGVVFDEHRPHILATFSDGSQEVVKIWDIRQLDNPTGPLMTLNPTSKTLSQISWSPVKAGVLATSSPEERWISLWDIEKQEHVENLNNSTSPSTNSTVQPVRKPFKRRYLSEPVVSFSWQHDINARCIKKSTHLPKSSDSNCTSESSLTSLAFPNRIITASIAGGIEDISIHDTMPLTISAMGRLSFACGKLLFYDEIHKNTSTESSAIVNKSEHQITKENIYDISFRMRTLVKQGYSINLMQSLVLCRSYHLSNTDFLPYRELYRLWQWVDQVEYLRRFVITQIAQSIGMIGSNMSYSGPLRGWPIDAQVLVNAGVLSLLQSPLSNSNDALDREQRVHTSRIDPILNCTVYESLGRRLTLFACQWDADCGQVMSTTLTSSNSNSSSNLSIHSAANSNNSNRLFLAGDANGLENSNMVLNQKYNLKNIIESCEKAEENERGAFLAVVHGDLSSAVSILQKGAMRLIEKNQNDIVSMNLANNLQLVAMAIAGYYASSFGGAKSLWVSMCQQLLNKDDIILSNSTTPRYLYSLCKFLCTIKCASSLSTPTNSRNHSNSTSLSNSAALSANSSASRRQTRRHWSTSSSTSESATNQYGDSTAPYSMVDPLQFEFLLNDVSLPLSDRIAFACRFLPTDNLMKYVNDKISHYANEGLLEGLILTGLNKTGVHLLQQYLNRTSDVQTVALLSARLPFAYTEAFPVLGNWIETYQQLLNKLQFYQERALFDVNRAQLQDQLYTYEEIINPTDPNVSDLNATSANTLEKKTPTVPPQLYVRCNFCGNSLSLSSMLRMGNANASWLNRAKMKLTCCTSCRKPLPQCALCLLPFGSLNPYFELAYRKSKQKSDSTLQVLNSNSKMGSTEVSGTSMGDHLSELSNIPFMEWFTWCQTCKHGGHANHIADWFEKHQVCPVSDCDCKCMQLDAPTILPIHSNSITTTNTDNNASASIANQVQSTHLSHASDYNTSSKIGDNGDMNYVKHHHQQEFSSSNPETSPLEFENRVNKNRSLADKLDSIALGSS